jgi:hypothetical protein
MHTPVHFHSCDFLADSLLSEGVSKQCSHCQQLLAIVSNQELHGKLSF